MIVSFFSSRRALDMVPIFERGSHYGWSLFINFFNDTLVRKCNFKKNKSSLILSKERWTRNMGSNTYTHTHTMDNNNTLHICNHQNSRLYI